MLRVIKYFAKSLKVIRNGTIRKLGYGFLFAFHSKVHGSILDHFRDKARYWPKIAFIRTTAFDTPVGWGGGSRRSVAMPFNTNKKLSCRTETARRFVSLNILLSHSRSLKVIRNDTVE